VTAGLAALFESGRIVDLILAVVLLEGLVIYGYRRRLGRGLSPAQLLSLLLPGVCLLMALRAALDGAAWPWVALWLLAALVSHLADLRQRWRACAAAGRRGAAGPIR
jgi:hypothetical protein